MEQLITGEKSHHETSLRKGKRIQITNKHTVSWFLGTSDRGYFQEGGN